MCASLGCQPGNNKIVVHIGIRSIRTSMKRRNTRHTENCTLIVTRMLSNTGGKPYKNFATSFLGAMNMARNENGKSQADKVRC